MYISLLKLDPRSRRAVTESSRPYELHRSLLTAFPEEAAGGPGRVLFRLDINPDNGDMTVLVQSEKQPDWTKLNASGGFVKECRSKEINSSLSSGQILRFRLRANPTKRSHSSGKRQGILNEEEQRDWLHKKGLQGGFEIIDASVVIVNEGFAKDKLTDNNNTKHDTTMLSVRYDGLLRVVDQDSFLCTIQEGIGSAKGFGFGLLSLAQVKE